MKCILFLFFICLFSQGVFAADYVNGSMMDIVQYERGITPDAKRKFVTEAFSACTNPTISTFFFTEPFYAMDEKTRIWSYLSNDSLRLQSRLMHTCVMDLDGDGQKEILFHEYNRDNQKQVSVILRYNKQNTYDAILVEYGVISNMTFESRKLKSIHITEIHAYYNPCDKIKLYNTKAVDGNFEIVPHYYVNVPYNYMYPVKVAIPDRIVQTTNDTLFMYYHELFKGRNFPYKIEMRTLFDQKKKFNSLETKWPAMFKGNYYFTGFVEERDDFTALMVAINTSFADACPEYQFIYVPTVYILNH